MSAITYKQLGYNYGGPVEMLTSTVDPTKLGPHDILVKISAAAINPVDFKLYNSHRVFCFFSRGPKGFGKDFSGIVEGIGSEVTRFAKGDKVSGLWEPFYTAFGTLGEYLVLNTVKNKNIGTVPQNLSMVESAAFPLVLGTAFTTLMHFKKPQDCESVLVIGGATSVGSFVLQLLKNVHGVKNVVSVNSTSSAPRVKSHGADIVIDYKKGDVKSQVLALVHDIGKFDLIIDCVGNNYLFSCMDDVLKPKSENSGYVSINGSGVGDYNTSIWQYVTWENLKLFFLPKSWNFKMSAISSGTWYESAKGLFEEGLLKVPIDSVYDFEDYQKAFEKILDHKAQGKIVVQIGKD